MGNCCQQNQKDEFEVEVLGNSTKKQAGAALSDQFNSSTKRYDAAAPLDDSQNNHQRTSQAEEEIKDSDDNDDDNVQRDDSFAANNCTYDNEASKSGHQQNTQNTQGSNIKQKFNLKLDLNKINNEVSFSQNSEQDEPLMHRRKSSSENVNNSSQPDSYRNYQQSNNETNNNQSNISSNQHNHNHARHHQNKLTIDDTDQYEPYEGPPVPRKQLNIKLDLERINEQNENEEYNPNSLKRKI